MVDPIRELKIRAERLHAAVDAGRPEALQRLRLLSELATVGEDVLAEATGRLGVQRKHCLCVVAREHGFDGWEHARRVLLDDVTDGAERDFGTMLYDRAVMGTLNVWFPSHTEARAHLDEATRAGLRRYLLPYRTRCFVVDDLFVRDLGLDPDDADWSAIEFDWVRPRDREARRRLVLRRLRAQGRAS